MDWRKPGVEVEKPIEEKGVLGGPGITMVAWTKRVDEEKWAGIFLRWS